MVLIEVLFGHLKRRILSAWMLWLCSCPVQGRRARFTGLLPAAAIAAVKPEKQAQEEKRRHEHEKDQHGFQKTIHSKTSFYALPHSHALTRLIGRFPYCRGR